MDILYIVREGPNEELRYSLRSLQNLPHDRVIVAGGAPEWLNLDTVDYVPVSQEIPTRHDAWVTKYVNARKNLAEGLYMAGGEVALFNDDMFVTAPIDEVPILHMGTEKDFREIFRSVNTIASRYVEGEVNTLRWVQKQYGIAQPLSYALHTPFLIKTKFALKLLAHMPHQEPPLHFRTAYGNAFNVGGEFSRDCKITGQGKRRGLVRLNGKVVNSPEYPRDLPTPFVSTNERSFDNFEIGRKIRKLFPDKSPYER